MSDGKKTILFEDMIYDRNEGRDVKRTLTISGSDRYGLPTAKDDDVLLACIQITKLQEFQSPEVTFSRYEILKLLRWSDDTRNYHRISQSLRRWKGLSIYSDRAFYDHAEKSWVNRDFGVFDSLYVYRREVEQGVNAPGASKFTWNDVIFKSFQAGYMKRLDWGLYTRLESPVAKRLYRFLDKRFYHGNTVEIDLKELALNKVRLSSSYNVAQMKRALLKGIAELEREWELKPLVDSKRFEKASRGEWLVRFERKARRKPIELLKATPQLSPVNLDSANLEYALTKRGVGPASAEELVERYPSSTVQTMVELYDWYNLKGHSRNAGFLVHAIKNAAAINFPAGFESSGQMLARKDAEKNRIASQREFETKREVAGREKENRRFEAFKEFWAGLSPSDQYDFEREAVNNADATKLAGYSRSQGKGGPLFEHYRTIVLRDHFERIRSSQVKAQ